MLKALRDQSLAEFCWYKTGGKAAELYLPESIEELGQILESLEFEKTPVTILGSGTNVLISDDGIPWPVICLKDLNAIEEVELPGRIGLIADAGVQKAKLAKHFMGKKLAPANFLSGIPGDVGGGVAMNAGIGEKLVPREFVEITDWIEVFQFIEGQWQLRRFENKDLNWAYRSCAGFQPGLIARAQLSWADDVDPGVGKAVRAAMAKRKSSQPLEFPSCGSVFKNPLPNHSGALIEGCGLKGHQIGQAQVSEKHANFIINKGGAKSADILGLIEHVRATVKAERGIELQTEVRLLGKWAQLEPPKPGFHYGYHL